MKRTLIFTGIGFVAAFLMLYLFNRFTSKPTISEIYTQAIKGEFVIEVSSIGQLIAEKSTDINGPSFERRRDIRSRHIKIQDLIPEGTNVTTGDYVATLDRTEVDNTLKDQRERLKTLMTNLEMKKLDTAVVLNSLRDGIKNQKYVIEEASITLRNSKYEPPATIRRAEIELNKSKRVMEQLKRSYLQRSAQFRADISNQDIIIARVAKRVSDLEELLAGFTITAPANGMVIYYREWNGKKRQIGSSISPHDRIVAVLPDLTAMMSRVFVSEIDISKIRPGLNVDITVDAFPKKVFTGTVSYIANIGERLPNTSDKVFEVHIKIAGSDPSLRPSMTTGNRIIVKTIADAVYVPVECVHSGADSIAYVYTKNGDRQTVLLGDSNGKYIVIEKGLEPGTMIYLNTPPASQNFRITGQDLILNAKESEKTKRAENIFERTLPEFSSAIY